jgi:hypothetical protein
MASFFYLPPTSWGDSALCWIFCIFSVRREHLVPSDFSYGRVAMNQMVDWYNNSLDCNGENILTLVSYLLTVQSEPRNSSITENSKYICTWNAHLYIWQSTWKEKANKKNNSVFRTVANVGISQGPWMLMFGQKAFSNIIYHFIYYFIRSISFIIVNLNLILNWNQNKQKNWLEGVPIILYDLMAS